MMLLSLIPLAGSKDGRLGYGRYYRENLQDVRDLTRHARSRPLAAPDVRRMTILYRDSSGNQIVRSPIDLGMCQGCGRYVYLHAYGLQAAPDDAPVRWTAGGFCAVNCWKSHGAAQPD